MMNIFKILFLIVIIFPCCTTWKASLNTHGNTDSVIENAILDFSNTTSLFTKDNTFAVKYNNEIDNGIIGVSILGTVNKFIVTENGKSSRLPTRILEYKGKLFYWFNKNTPLNNEVINKLDKYNLIDSVKSIAFAEFINEDAKKEMHYYFCNTNFNKYKKVKTSVAMGYYEPPILKCKE